MPKLEKLLKDSALRSRSVASWPARSNFTPALQSVATLDMGDHAFRPLPPLRLGLHFAESHSNANYFLTAAVTSPTSQKKILISCSNYLFTFATQITWHPTLNNRSGFFVFAHKTFLQDISIKKGLPEES